MRQEIFPVAGPVEAVVRIQAGDVAVETADVSDATVTLEALDGAAEKALDDVKIELSRSRLVVEHEKGLRIGLLMRGPSFRVSVRVPHGSGLDVATVSATVRAEGRLGELDAKTVSGDVSVDHVSGGASVKTVSGAVGLGSVGGRVSVNTVLGDVKVAEAARDVDAKTVSGDQSFGSITEGQAQLQSVSGDIRIGIRRGSGVWFDLRSASGKTVSELEPADGPVGDGPSVELRAKAVSGDIRIVRAA